MTLIQSISGIRGTVGGMSQSNLTPLEVVRYISAYGNWISEKTDKKIILLGRDARISGDLFKSLAAQTLIAQGFQVVDLDLTTTPTLAFNVTLHKAAGGIMVTASHNPIEWNALKFFNQKGEFISATEAEELFVVVNRAEFRFSDTHHLGKLTRDTAHFRRHIDAICELDLVNLSAIREKNFSVLVDVINSTGALVIPQLLKRLGVAQIKCVNAEPNGKFARRPEPIAENLVDFCNEVSRSSCDFGIVVDPDVDRLVFVCEDGTLFGEEYSLVAIADYVLKHKKGTAVSTLSSSDALRTVAKKYECPYVASPVGEVNVVKAMKDNQAVIGGEGSGGIIYPDLHYSRDALVGIALFLSHLSEVGRKVSELRATYPNYSMAKNQVTLLGQSPVAILTTLTEKYKQDNINTEDGLKVYFENQWVHFRKSNTEPILRIYTEALTLEKAQALAYKMKAQVQALMQESK